MGGFLKVVGAITLVLVALIVALVVWGLFALAPLNKEATAYADQAIPAIAANWDRNELLKRAAPELKQSLTPAGLDSVYSLFASFGPMVKYNGATCAVTGSLSTASGKVIVAKCVATAKCQNADVSFQLSLLRENNVWLIGGIFVAKTVLANAPASGAGFGTLPEATAPEHTITWLSSHALQALRP